MAKYVLNSISSSLDLWGPKEPKENLRKIRKTQEQTWKTTGKSLEIYLFSYFCFVFLSFSCGSLGPHNATNGHGQVLVSAFQGGALPRWCSSVQAFSAGLRAAKELEWKRKSRHEQIKKHTQKKTNEKINYRFFFYSRVVFPNFGPLDAKILNFWPQIRILRNKSSPEPAGNG